VSFRRATRIVLARWPIIVVAGLIGAALALGFANVYNRSITPRFQATAPVTFIQLDRETDAAFAARLDEAQSTALRITADDPDAASLDVQTDADAGTVSFVVDAPSADEAQTLATQFRNDYLTAEPSSAIVEQITSRLASIRTEVADLQTQLAALQPASPTVSPDMAALYTLVQSKLGELRQEAASIRLQLAVPDLAETDTAALQQQLDVTTQVIAKLETELNSLTPPSSPSTTTDPAETTDMDVLVLQRRINDLESQYIDLSLRLVDLGTTGDLNGGVTVTDETVSPVGRKVAGAAGLVVGLLLAFGAILALDAVRRPLRAVGDVAVAPSLGLVDPASSKERGPMPWYVGETKKRRKGQIQSVRSALSATIKAGSTLGISPLGVSTDDARLFAADLAASVAATGREVLLLDATFPDGLPITEYGDASVTLTDLASQERSLRESTLRDRPEVMPLLRGFRSGNGGADPADLVAGRGFQDVLEDATKIGYVIVLAMPPADSTVGEELTQLLDTVLVTARLKRTTDQQIQTLVDDLASRRAGLAGVVLLTGSEKLRYEGSRRGKRTRRVEAADEVDVEQESVETAPSEVPSQDESEAPMETPAPRSRRERRLRAVPDVDETPRQGPPKDSSGVEEGSDDPKAPSAPRHAEPGSVSSPRAELGASGPVGPPVGEASRVSVAPAPFPMVEATGTDGPGKHAAALRSSDRSGLAVAAGSAVDVDATTRVVITTPNELARTAERFLMAVVSALVAAPGGVKGVPQRLVDAEGMVPVSEGLGSLAAADRLVQILPEVLQTLPPTLSDAVEERLGCIFGLDSGETCRRRIDTWLRHRFTPTRQSGVWLMSSTAGAFQMLVNGALFNAAKARLLLVHDVRVLKTHLGRASRQETYGHLDAGRLTDVMEFESTLRKVLAQADDAQGAFDWHGALKAAGLLAGDPA
jgi:hypothetical protein